MYLETGVKQQKCSYFFLSLYNELPLMLKHSRQIDLVLSNPTQPGIKGKHNIVRD